MTPSLARLYIGAQIKEARMGANLTQAKLAESVGMSRRCLISLESGERDIRLPMLFEISKKTGAKFIDLLPKEYVEQ